MVICGFAFLLLKVSKRDLNVRPRNLLLFGFPVILHISEMVAEDSTED